jgi:uncharacterized membrane protein YeaQ/YmgE (transglycosylase-associated protein family)
MMKTLIFTGMIVGSFVGGYLPVLWGGSVFSISSILWSAVGAFAGIWIGYKISIRFDL